MHINIKQYKNLDRDDWNCFIKKAKNSHFMFYREYMEYHSNRFEDLSLLVYNEKNKLVAVFPANRTGNVIHSHQGLTFGGLIMGYSLHAEKVLKIFEHIINFYKAYKIEKIIYKAIPYIYHLYPAEEDIYALFRLSAKLIRRDISSAIYLNKKLNFTESRKSSIRKAKKGGVIVSESTDFKQYWRLLESVTYLRHGVKPVHRLEEFVLLAKLFPNNIKLFIANSSSQDLLAGAVLYVNHNVVHTQYLATSELGRSLGALDLVIDNLISIYHDSTIFDFGISTECQGNVLNNNLIFQKEGFGGRGIVHDFYEINLR